MQDRRNAKATWKTAKLVNCIVCGCKFISQRGTARFCCANCQLKYYLNNNQKQKIKNKKLSKKLYHEKYKFLELSKSKKKQNRQRMLQYVKTKKFKNYIKKKYHCDIQFKMSMILRTRFHTIVKNKQNKYYNSCMKLLGCSLDQFIVYIEKQFSASMNWKNYGKVWHIDHIIPCSYFDLTKIEHQKQCFHYTNLQPMFASENLTKKNKIYFGDTFLSSSLLKP